MTLRKWEWLTAGTILLGIGALVLAGLTVRAAATGAELTWLAWVGVGALILVGLVLLVAGVTATPLKVRVDDRGITQQRGALRRHVPWSQTENLWVAKRNSTVSLVSTSAAPAGAVHPWDKLQAGRLNVKPQALIGSIRPDQLDHLQQGIRVHGRRELPVVYAH